jgi:cytochrome c-type biogenesis protein CcmH
MNFWIVVASLTLVALVILLVPLIRASRTGDSDQRMQQNIQISREKKQLLDTQLGDGELDQAEYDAAFSDLQTSLAIDLGQKETSVEQTRGKWMALVVLIMIPAASLAMYFSFGEYRVIENPKIAQVVVQQNASTGHQMSLEEMLVSIKEKLRENPDDARGWYSLGRVLMATQQYEEAVVALRRCYALVGDDPEILFSLADALALESNGVLLGEPEQLIEKGLAMAPRHPNGLWLAGLMAEQRQDFKSAHRYWNQLLPLIADNQESTKEVKRLISMLEQNNPDIKQPEIKQVSINAKSISLEIDISDELKNKANPEDLVFVYAKAMQGPPMPLAVKKLQLKDLPASLILSDEDAMMPSMTLSSFDQVIVGARVSKSGNPVAQQGDFYTEISAVDSSNQDETIELLIDQVK